MDSDERTVIFKPLTGSLKVTLPDGKEAELELSGDQTVLGRARECDLVLADERVSRRHAIIHRQEQGFVIQDQGSANRTRVNGEEVLEQALADGDRITLGETEISVSISGAPAPSERTVVMASPTASPKPSPGKKSLLGKKSKSRLPKGGDDKKRALIRVGAITVIVVVLLIVAISTCGKSDKTGKKPAEKAAVQKEQAVQPAPPAPTAPPKPQPAAPAAKPSQAVSPQDKAKAAALFDKGQIFYESGRLRDAIKLWHQALELDPTHALAKLRMAKAKQELTQQAQAAFDRGLRNFKYLNYEGAIQEWAHVLNLVPDPTHPLHQKALSYIEQARVKLKR